MKISRYFTKEKSPYEDINFVTRVSKIIKLDGSIIFKNENVIVPDSWSQVPVDILAQKYFRRKGLGADGKDGETDSRQVFERLAKCWMDWGTRYKYFDSEDDSSAFKDELLYMLSHQIAAPNSPQWFNTGLFNSYGINGPSQGHFYFDPDSKELKASQSSYERPQPHACFILSIKDDLVNSGGIMDLWTREARLFKYGSGTGTNFSNLRGVDETLSGGGRSSGLMSFLVIGDKAAGAIKSGGTTRRAAKMVIVNSDHPDIEAFCDWKVKEERKVVAMAAGSQVMRRSWDRMCKAVETHSEKDPNPYTNDKLKKAVTLGYKEGLTKSFISQCLGRLTNGDFNRDLDLYDTNWDGEAYLTVNGMNSNNSVRATNDYMDAVKNDGDWDLIARTDGRVVKTIKAKDLWDKIVKAAWYCADPGLQFDTTINEWHTCLTSGRINGSNPCCITGDTLISVADGRISVPIKELVGTTVNVYTWDPESKKTVIAPMYNISVKRTGAPVYKVTLDDGSSFKTTDDHLLMLKEGGYRKVMDLQSGDSLNPIHGKLYEWAQKGHTPRWCTWTGRGWRAQYRMVWEHANGPQPKKMHIHHKDWDAQNDSLENLELLTPEAHTEIHVSHMTGENNPVHRLTEEQKQVWKEKLRAYFTGEQNPNFGKIHSSKTKLKMVSRWTSERKEATRIHMTEVQLARMAAGEEVGRPKNHRYELSCAVCRNKFISMSEERLYCSQLCGVRGTASLRSAKLKGRVTSKEIKAQLSISNRRAAKPENIKKAQLASIRNKCLKVGKLLLESNKQFTFESWDSLKPVAKELGAYHFPKSEVLQNIFCNEEEFLDQAQHFNHKVVSVEFAGNEDVYDGTVDGYHNFGIYTSRSEEKASGIFIHNSEYMFLDDTACNLASLNLNTFLNNGVFNVEAYRHAIRIWTMVLEISVLMAQYPSPEIAHLSYQYRTLGLGYANLGSMLMRLGIPYDSDLGRSWAGALTAILTGDAYATSALLAKELGPFEKYSENKNVMLRVISNHRSAAYNAKTADYEDLSITPQGLKIRALPRPLGQAVKESWDSAWELGKLHGYRNAQVTCLAPTGTIGLLMDCDTTGVEPDFSLVKFKKLAGGGYFKLVNQSLPESLNRLGYRSEEIEDIVEYVVGAREIHEDTPGINLIDLQDKGFTIDMIRRIENSIPAAFDPSYLFSLATLSEDDYRALGIDPDSKETQPLLEQLGFTTDQIELFYTELGGRLTVEGAPHLKPEHLPIFDCANRCGKNGKRFIAPMGHVNMMAAVQPFLSGAISKTVNLPAETSMDEISYIYEEAWKLGLKSVALYRDGSKMSQALSTNLDLLDSADVLLDDTESKVEKSKVLADSYLRSYRRKLPNRRGGYTQSSTIGTTKLYLRTGEYEDGGIGEIFLDTHREGAAFRSLLNAFAISVSMGLQYGVPLEEFCDAFMFTKFEPAGMVRGNDSIKMAHSIIDYVFRELAITYMGRTDLVQGEDEANEITKPVARTIERKKEKSEKILEKVELIPITKKPRSISSAREKGYTGDACTACGNLTMVRSGTCLKCVTCGETSGCS